MGPGRLLDAVLHIATCAIELFVQPPPFHSPLVSEVTTKPGFFSIQVLRLGHNVPFAVPSALLRFLGAVFKFGKHPRRLAGLVPQLGRFLHLPPDDTAQSLVARQAKHKVHSIVFAPARCGKTGIAAQDNLHGRPRRPNLRHDALYLLPAAERGVVVGFSQPRTQHVLAATNIQREVALVFVVAVEESPLLLAM
jgi:hypothetical protein